MATRLDRVSTTANRTPRQQDHHQARLRQLRETRADSARATVAAMAPSSERQELSPRALGGAMASWLALTFGLCYVVFPALTAITGINPSLIFAFWFDLPAFAIAAFVATVGVLVERPRLDLLSGARDPILAATLGGLGVWAVIHNVSGYLVPFGDMTGLQLASVLGINVVKMTMLGTMFASFTKRTDVALALGGGFQLGAMGLFLTLVGLVLG